MDRAQRDEWAKAFVADLEVAGERIPFEQVVAKHFAVLDELNREIRRKWVSIAAILARAGAMRQNGRLYNPGQLRAAVSRVRNSDRAPSPPQPPEAPRAAQSPAQQRPPVAPQGPPSSSAAPAPRPGTRAAKPVADKAVSPEEIVKAMGAIARK